MSNLEEQKQPHEEPGEEEEEEEGEEEAPITTTRTARVEGLPLDWTQLGSPVEDMPIRYPHDVAEISSDELEIIIVGTAGQKITFMSDDFYTKCNPNLESLVLRSHLISEIKGIQGFTKLEVLELYDNQLKSLACLEGPGPNLRILDMSYNAIRDMMPVTLCPNLTELYLANNKLKEIKGLKGLKMLRKLDLGANRIRVMDGEELGGMVNLEELWIGKNKIEQIQGLEQLNKLRRLDVQSNRLTTIENLTTQAPILEELYLAHNGIDDEGASMDTGLALNFPNLNVIDMCRNRLTSTTPFAHLEGLEELWISGNQVSGWEDVKPLQEAALAGKQSLETVYLEHNPVASEFEYRKKLAEMLPSLNQIDANLIGGLAAHGMPTTVVQQRQSNFSNNVTNNNLEMGSLEEQMRQLQTTIVERAREETEAYKEQEKKDSDS